MKYDFGGWATKHGIRCSDGRTICKNAFKDCDGTTVPLVYQHNHSDLSKVIGHADLENRDEGVYAYCTLNETENGQNAKELVRHGDICALSIYANKLKQNGGDVLHGVIREVSLVLSGANPGAMIDSVMLHGEYNDEDGIIYNDDQKLDLFVQRELDDEVSHSEGNQNGSGSEGDSSNSEGSYEDSGTDAESEDETDEADDDEDEEEGESYQSIYDGMSDKQKAVVRYIAGRAIIEGNKSNKGDEDMKHNVFETEEREENALAHDALASVLADGKRYGSLKESWLQHEGELEKYGIDDVPWLFPNEKNLNVPPEFIQRDMDWVSFLMSGVHHSPFSRIKSMFADITEDEARAKGYIKGNKKKDEVFGMLKRSTTPTTIYKKQRMDRDDIVDITDFNVVEWIKKEMRVMLDEEIARAILIGDGRSAASDDKINEQCIRPIWKDDDLFVIKKDVVTADNATDDQKAKALIRAAIKARKDYKGSGEPTMFTTEDTLTDLLLLEDLNGRRIYESESTLATAMRVKRIVTCPLMENQVRTDDTGGKHNLKCIIVNLKDYNVGMDKGGAVTLFDDFDIDYNQQKYLIETRMSGALTKPYSAIVLETPAS